jgi:peptide/nickel transport system substrate-binding protein
MTHRVRTALAVLAALSASALVLSGCAGDGETPAESQPPKAGGDVVFAIDTVLTSFDPNVAAAAQDARIMRQIYDSLVVLDADKTVQPWLAESWTISDDGLTYTFTVRDDVVFHDGTPFNGEAVCFNLDRIKDPASASIYAIGLIGPYASCEAPDETTAVVTLASPYAPFLQILSSPFLGIVSPTAASEAELADFAINPVGSGPFVFESYTPNDRIVLKKNADYAWAPSSAEHDGAPLIDSLTFQIIPDATVRLGSLRSGAIQGVGNVPETEASAIESDASLTFYAQAQSGSPYQLNFNTEREPFDDPAVRSAIRSAIDIDSAVQALYLGVYERAWGPLAPTTLAYDESIEGSFSFDAAAAAKSLDDAGWVEGSDGVRTKNGERLTLEYLEFAPNREKRQDIAEFVKANLAEIGVEVDVRIDQVAGYQASLQAGDYDIAGLSLVSADPNVVYSLYSPQFRAEPGRNGFNFTRVDQPELTDLVLAAQQEQDEAARIDLYSQIQKYVIDEALSIGFYVPTYTVATNGIQGLRFDSEGYPVFYDVSLVG